MHTTERIPPIFQVRLKLFLTAIFWGGTFIAGRIVTRHMGPFSAAFLRFLIATIFLFLMIWKTERKISLLSYRQFLLLALLGISGIFAYNYFFFSGLKLIHAGRAA
ncbi:MAG: DMT family transporter, partial [bacterium]